MIKLNLDNTIPVKIRYNNEGRQTIETIPPVKLPNRFFIMDITGETIIIFDDVYMRGYIHYDPEISNYN